MEFYIDSSKYFLRNETDGAFTLMVLETNQTLDFSAFYQPLLKTTDRWTAFSAFAQAMLLVSFGRRDTVRLFLDALYSLHAAGIARLKDIPFDARSGIRWARQRDYAALSEFCSANYDQGFSRCAAANPGYYSHAGFYTRLGQKAESDVLKVEDGKIRAVILCGPSFRFFGGPVFELKSFGFAADLEEQACRAAVKEMVGFLAEHYPKMLRYERLVPQQDFIVSALKDAGFSQTALLKRELKNGLDLCLWDYQAENRE